MQASLEESEQISSPSLSSDFPDKFAQFCDDLSGKMKLDEEDEEDEEEVEDGDEEFSFACIGADGSPISADDVFEDGQIKAIFPLFDQSLLFDGDSTDLPRRPPVKNVFVETEDPAPPLSAAEADLAGPYCEWSRKAVEASPSVCKKSNSTGFSKFWRFRDLVHRSNSDGRDAFVFLNNGNPAPAESSKAVEKTDGSSEKKIATSVVVGEVKATDGGGVKVRTKKVKKSVAAPLEQYMRNRGEDNRKRSYLPYRPELMGFFTNVNGGLSRNVHPF